MMEACAERSQTRNALSSSAGSQVGAVKSVMVPVGADNAGLELIVTQTVSSSPSLSGSSLSA